MEHTETYSRGNVVIEIIRSESEACKALSLKINGKKALMYNFGISKDIDPDKAPPCGCGNRVFIPKVQSEYVLKKYGLTLADNDDLCALLKEALSVGFCKRCK